MVAVADGVDHHRGIRAAFQERELRPVGIPHPGRQVAALADEGCDQPRAGRDDEAVDAAFVGRGRTVEELVPQDVVGEERLSS